MQRKRRTVARTIIRSLFLWLLLFSTYAFGQRQFHIREMRSKMSSDLEVYSFGYSWDNKSAFDSLNQTFIENQRILEKKFLWKNRPGNDIERDFLRLLANFGISSLDDQKKIDPLVRTLLEYDPYLIPSNSDNTPDLNNQLRSFYPLPSLKVGFKLGINLNNTLPNKVSYEVVQNSSSGKSYSPDIGWMMSLSLTYLLTRNSSLSIEPGVSYSNINITQNILGDSQKFKYRIYFTDIPVVYKLNLLNPRLNGFKNISQYNELTINKLDRKLLQIDEKIGKSKFNRATKLDRKKNEVTTRRNHLEMNTPYRRIIPSLILGIKPKVRIASFFESNNANELTKWIQFDAIAGVGFEWYQPRTTYSLEFRYNYGLTEVNTSERYYIGGEIPGLLFDNFYVSDDFRMQIFEISFVTNYIFSNKAFKFR